MKIVRISLLLFATLFIWLLLRQYFFCPRYSFPDPVPFSGNNLYNPYQDADSTQWIKCNFHAHAGAWEGLTHGNGSVKGIDSIYNAFGYAIHCVSDYEKINRTDADSADYISAYEHGYNLMKNHQLVLGDKKVTWLDYLFPQTLSNEQDVLNRLKRNPNNVIFINHPGLDHAYNPADMKWLSGYQCIEVLNPAAQSFAHWDSALSAGKPVFISADDDVHFSGEPLSFGRFCTNINSAKADKKDTFRALRKGIDYATLVPPVRGETFQQRKIRITTEIPRLERLQLENDSIFLSLNKPAKEIIFSGQGGKELSTKTGSATASYVIRPGDHYVRTSVVYRDGVELFLNPIFRYSNNPLVQLMPVVNKTSTVLFRIAGTFLFLVWLVVFYRLAFRRKKESKRDISSLFFPTKQNFPKWESF